MESLTRFHLAVAVGIFAVAAPIPARAAPAVHDVQVGALNPADPDSTFNYTRYYPNRIQVHRGDTVRWRWATAGYFSWHTVSFLPGDMDVATYPGGLEAAFPPALRTDELGQALNEQWVFGHPGSPTGGSLCGRGPWLSSPVQDPCTLSSTEQLVSSSLSDTFLNMAARPDKITWRATIDLAPGRYRYHCLVHPRMSGEVEVIPDDLAFDKTAEQIAEETAQQVAADTAPADALVESLSDPTSAYDPETATWRVHVGAETVDGHVTVYSFLPAELEVPAGATVEYVAGTGEPNTVTFPPDLHGGFGCGPTECSQGPSEGLTLLAFPITCEQDQAATGLPGIPLYNIFDESLFCVVGDREWTVSPYMARGQEAPGGEVATGATFHNSGMLFEESAPTWAAGPFREIPRYPSTFKASFPNAGEFTYACIAHGDFMKGSINVQAA